MINDNNYVVGEVYGGGGVSIKNGELIKDAGYIENRALTKYRDTLLKADFYRNRIIANLSKYGEILSDKAIQDRLEDIDLYQPIFKHENVKPGQLFDVEKYNYDMNEIQQDLEYLYELLYQISVTDLDEVRNFLDTHLREMEMEAKRYGARVDIETNSSKLGESLFYKDGPFPWFTRDNYAYTDLGEASLYEGNILGLIVSGVNVTHENIMVGFELDGDVQYITPYNYMNDTYKMPGDSQRKQYELKLSEDTNINRSFELKIPDFQPIQNNNYVAYAGHGLLRARQDGREALLKEDDVYDYFVEGKWNVSFYIKDATYARFEFSREISNKSFSGYEIADIRDVQYVTMSDANEFAFKLHTDGKVYAERSICYVREGSLYYPKATQTRDFLIEELTKGRERKVRLYLRVKGDGMEYPEIDSIAIKELIGEDVLDDLL